MPGRKQGIMQLFKRLWPLFVFLGVTVFLTYPVSLNPASLVIGRPFDDAFEHIWYLQWYKHALLNLHVSPLFQPDIFSPEGWDLSFASLPPLFPILLAPVTAVLGPVATYNLVLLVSTVLAAYGVFLLVRAMGGTSLGGIFAGLLYAFYPNRQVYMHGFFNHLLGSMWLPWALYGLYQAVNRPRSRGRWLLFSSLAYSLSIGGAWQYVYISTFVLLIFGLFYLLPSLKRELALWVKPLLLATIPILFIAVPLLVNGMLARERMGSSAEFSLEDLSQTSVSVERLLVPSALNPLFWDLVRETYPLRNGEDGVVTFGFSALILAAIVLIWIRPWPRHTWALFALAVIGLLFMAGPFLQWQGETVVIQWLKLSRISEISPGLKAAPGAIKLPMPALFIYRFVPPLRSFHHFGRFGVVVAMSLGILAGLGLSTIQRRFSPQVGVTIGLACLLMLLIEFNPQPLSSVTAIAGMERDVDDWLRTQPDQSTIMEYPLWYSPNAQSLYYTIAHQQKIFHGYSSISSQFLEMRPTLALWPEKPAIDLLEQNGVDYVLVHVPEEQDDFETTVLPELMEIDRLALVGRFPRKAVKESIPSYWNGRIQPMVDIMKETYVFELVGGR